MLLYVTEHLRPLIHVKALIITLFRRWIFVYASKIKNKVLLLITNCWQCTITRCHNIAELVHKETQLPHLNLRETFTRLLGPDPTSPVFVCLEGTCRQTGTPGCDLGRSWWAKPAARQVTEKGAVVLASRQDFRYESTRNGSTAAQPLQTYPRSLVVVMSVHVFLQASSKEMRNISGINHTTLTKLSFMCLFSASQ